MKERNKICILTATRAEYGLLKPVIQKLKKVPEFDVLLAVTGMHLSPEFGLTHQEIENDGISIDEKIEIQMSSDTPAGISKTMAMALMGFADYFAKIKPDLLLVLGDRYETLAVCCAAMNQGIPIAHMHGGETTEGAIDEAIRHSITKMSYLHFTSTEGYRKRVIQLGESPDRVFNVGSTGVENILNERLLSMDELEKGLGKKIEKPYAMVTYHPETLQYDSTEQHFKELLDFCINHQEINFIFTKANADTNGRIINSMIDDYIANYNNAMAFSSLGTQKYLSMIKNSKLVIGNSSSGIIEAPSFKIPTINIGSRQGGRIQASSIVNCNPQMESVEEAYTIINSKEFQENIQFTVNPYLGIDTSKKIVDILSKYLLNGSINLQKEFYNITNVKEENVQ